MSTQLTLSQTAAFLNVSEKSIRRYIKAGLLPAKLIKGKKGNEYRIKKEDLKNFVKPPRGKKAHKMKRQQNKKIISNKKEKHLTPIRQIIEQNAKKIISLSEQSPSIIDYKLLYEKLLAKYEQSLIMIGSLEAQLSNIGLIPQHDEKIKKLEESVIKQEELILELYQIIQSYKKEKY